MVRAGKSQPEINETLLKLKRENEAASAENAIAPISI
jgi:hypothetical protein